VPDDEVTPGDLDSLVEFIRASRGFDFSGYKPNSVQRRVLKRMTDVGCSTVADYQDHLEVHPEEFAALFNTILINVTSFHRDRAAWDFLREEVVSRIISGKSRHEPVRVWSAGCASGEEAYSVAMVMADALGEDAFRDRVKIYATDVDDDALTAARQAHYDERSLEALPETYVERFFERTNGLVTFRADLRRSIIFGRHDLLQDAPISRLDLLVCRNTLMYFNAESQANVIHKFEFALREGGFLFLGKAETLLAHAPLFAAVDLRLRIFTKQGDGRPNALGRTASALGPGSDGQTPLRDAGLSVLPLATVLVDIDGRVVLVNQAAQQLLGVTGTDGRRSIQQLELSYRPVELRPLLAEAYSLRAAVEQTDVSWRTPDGQRRVLDVVVTPLPRGSDAGMLGAAITFHDCTPIRGLRDELERSRVELAGAYEELQSMNEELETTNEELQSTIEELETTNEELQSANEELETTNEELQSTNDQLHALNEELEVRGGELDRVNLYLGSILTGLRWAVIVLDRELRVTLRNHWSEDLWGLRGDEVQGRALHLLDIGLPTEPVLPLIRRCLEGRIDYDELQVKGRNRRGRVRPCRVVCTPLLSAAGVEGVILAVEELLGAPEGRAAD